MVTKIFCCWNLYPDINLSEYPQGHPSSIVDSNKNLSHISNMLFVKARVFFQKIVRSILFRSLPDLNRNNSIHRSRFCLRFRSEYGKYMKVTNIEPVEKIVCFKKNSAFGFARETRDYVCANASNAALEILFFLHALHKVGKGIFVSFFSESHPMPDCSGMLKVRHKAF